MRNEVIALGFFDGVHLGHGALLKRTVEAARAGGWTAAACTFDPHPMALTAGVETPLLTTPAERERLMRTLYGVERLHIVPFDRAMMTLPWEDFVTDILVRDFHACHVVAGYDYRFGYRGQGTAEGLRALCARLGLGCDIVGEVTLESRRVSSSAIRAMVADGEMERACRFLGHPYRLEGTVRHGKGLGHTLGFPTVNLELDPRVQPPAFGVYAAKAELPGGERALAAVNVGRRPTVNDGESVSVEGFLLDVEGQFYGHSVALELYHRLRPERKFDSLEALRRAVMENAEQVRRYFS